MMQALQTFVGEPMRHRRFDLAWYRISQLLHDRTNGAFDHGYMRMARLLRPKVTLPVSSQLGRERRVRCGRASAARRLHDPAVPAVG